MDPKYTNKIQSISITLENTVTPPPVIPVLS